MTAVTDTHDVELPERVKLHWLNSSFTTEPAPQVIRGLMPATGLILIYGESGTGKSTLAVDIGLHIVSGKTWRGRAVAQGLVLHLAGEGLYGLQARLAAAIHAGIVSPGAPYALIDAGYDLVQPGDLCELLEAIAAAESECGEKLALLIIDTLARCFSIDENDGAQMRLAIAACDQIRAETGAAVLLIHHAGKDTAKGARGHSSLRAAVDTEWLIEGRCNPRTLTVTKQRDLPTGEPMLFDLDAVVIGHDCETAEEVTACIVRHSDRPAPPSKPSGRKQAGLLAELERRYAAGAIAWTDADLRRIGRELGMSKSTARSAVLGLTSAMYLCSSFGGLTLKRPPEKSP